MRDYEININISDILDKSDAEKASDRASGKAEKKSDSKISKSGKKTDNANTVAVNLAISGTKAMISDVASYHLSNIGTVYDDQARQNEITNMINIGSSVIGSITTIGSAAALLGLPGLIISSVAEMGKNILKIVESNRNYNINQTLNQLQRVKSADRIGVLLSDKNR